LALEELVAGDGLMTEKDASTGLGWFSSR